MEKQTSLDKACTTLANILHRANSDSIAGRKSGQAVATAADGKSRVRIIYRPGGPAALWFLPV
jgi:hypothetical protein